MTFEEIKSKLHDRIDKDHGENFTCTCPAHEDKRASLSVSLGEKGRTLIKCHAGCTTEQILKTLGLTVRDLFPTNGTHRNGSGASGKSDPIVAIYDYRDQDGKLIFQVVRHQSKKFVQRRPGGKDWIYNLKGTERVLYRLPELLTSSADTWVLIPEGEKDVDNLRRRGYVATTNAGGASQPWLDSYNDALRGRKVCVLPDNDDPGRHHANDVAQHLLGIAGEVRLLALPGLPLKGDVTDWLDAGNDPKTLIDLVKDAPLFQPTTMPSAAQIDFTEQYRIVGGRICARTKVGRGDDMAFDYLPLCNFDAAIIADVEMDDGEEITRHVTITGKLASGRILPEIIIPTKDFDSLGWIPGKWGARPVLETGRSTKDRLRHAIQTLSADSIVDKRIFTHTGWRVIDGKRIFLHGAGAVGCDDVAVEMPGRLADYRFPIDNAVDPKASMAECIKLLDIAPMAVTAPIWSAMFLAPLSEIITPAFTLWVEGPSGSKKSTLAGLMLNMFGPTFHEKHMPADWLSTANHLEMLTFHAKDIPLVIDDFRPGESKMEEREMTDKAARIMRAVGNRQARGRLTKDRDSARAYIPRGMVIATAELGAIGKSVVARQLTVEVKKDDISLDLLSVAQGKRAMYGYAMRAFIQGISASWETVSQELQKEMADRRRTGDRSQHSRLPDAVNALYCAFDLAMVWATEIGAITKQDADRRCAECNAALLDLARRQQQKVEEEDPANKFVSALITLIHQREVLISGRTRADLGGRLRIGWWNGVELNLIPDAAFSAVVGFLGKSGQHFASTKADLGRDLKNAGWLAATENDKNQVKRSDGSEKVRVYCLSAARLFSLAAEMGLYLDDLQSGSEPRDSQ